MDFWWLGQLLLASVLIGGPGLLSRRMRLRELATYSLSDDQANDLSVALLEYVKVHSFEPKVEVSLYSFWRGRGLTDGDKGRILYPLVRERILLLVPTDPITRCIEWATLPLPYEVWLNPQEYWRMTRGGNVNNNYGTQFNELNQIGQQFQNEGSGTMSIGAAQVGDNSEAHVSDVGSTHQQGLSAADMLALAEALRADAATLDEAAARTVTELAQEIEEAVQVDDREGFGALFERVMQYASLLGTNLEQATRIIEAVQ